MLFSRIQITNPGLSGFISSDAAGFLAYAASFLSLIDIYFIFQIVLLVLGSIPLSGIAKTKSWIGVGISVFLLMLIQAVPGWLSSILSGLSTTRSFFFF
jgi:hypothetical protein